MKILFICHANLCRSFMAQEILKKLLPGVEVFSRGLYVNPSWTVPNKVLAFLAKHQITPAPHKPIQLTPDDLDKADFIFCMEEADLAKLTDRFAQHTDKLWLLADYAFGEEKTIEDPIALQGAAFEKQADYIYNAVDAAAKRLPQKS